MICSRFPVNSASRIQFSRSRNTGVIETLEHPAEETAMITRLSDSSLFHQQCYINGSWCDAHSGETLEVNNPADGQVLGTTPRMGAVETSEAIAAAEASLPAWSGLTAAERARRLRRWFELMLENKQDLAVLMTLEQGKPLAESQGEILYAASFVEWFAEEGKRVYGDVIPSTAADKRMLVLKQPVGVVAAITPWNFPSAMITRKAAPALAAGCTFLVKPAELTPYSAFALAELAERADIPAGVFNVLTGNAPEIGREMTSNPVVRKLTFTGSTAVGKLLMEQCAGTVKKVSMELGGNAPFLVFDDADLDAAVEGAMMSKFRNTGQTCVCANRILVQEGVYDAFAEKMAQAMQNLNVGSGLEEGSNQGPLINDAALLKVESHVSDAQSLGAKVYLGGERHALGGNFYQPTLLTGVTPEMKVAGEETFGPVAPLFSFKTEEEGVALANDTPFGLAAYFYARDLARVWRVSEALESGIVAVNTGIFSTEVAPFGGVKESGVGREGSRYGIDEYLEIKYVCMGGV